MGYLLLARIRYDHTDASTLDWLNDAAKQFNATQISAHDDHLFSMPSARACLDFALFIQMHKGKHMLDEDAVIVFGGGDDLAGSTRVRRLESLACRARPGAVLAVGSVRNARSCDDRSARPTSW